MENFPKYFRRLVSGNSPQIFPGINRNVENPGNYPMLVQEMQKIAEDPAQAARIAEAIDTSEPDIFRDFDLATFMDHFKMDVLSKTLLLSAVTHVSRQDLKAKGKPPSPIKILSSSDVFLASALLFDQWPLLNATIGNSDNLYPDIPPQLAITCALKYVEDIPREAQTDHVFDSTAWALEHRYKRQNLDRHPLDIRLALLLLNVLKENRAILGDLRHRGPQAASTLAAVKAILSQYHDQDLDEAKIGGMLLYMVLRPDCYTLNRTLFISAVHDYVEQPLEWQKVVRYFDQEDVRLSKEHFLAIYYALLPIAKEDSNFDIQELWGGKWNNPQAQINFLHAFVSCSASELDASKVPRLRAAYDPRESLDGSEECAKEVETAERDPMISLDAVTAIVGQFVPAEKQPDQRTASYLMEFLDDKKGLFLCSAAGMPKPWTKGLEHLLQALLQTFLNTSQPGYRYVLRTLWGQEKSWVAHVLIAVHTHDPLELMTILDLALELGWADDLFTLMSGFSFDFAALAHRKQLLDFDRWTKEKMEQDQTTFVGALQKFLLLKAQDELRISRDEQPEPRTVSLSIRTVYDMLAVLDEHMSNRVELKALQRQCLQAYPRLILLCEGIEENIDVGYKESNAMPRAADAEMQDMYKRMYSTELGVPNVLECLKECKGSDDPSKVDLFACMIHGLFDEFSCFSEYPLPPLATTAVLFGGIMQSGLISDLTLHVAQDMVLDSVRDFSPEASMYKFGLQALITITKKLREPEWTDYCLKLVKVPGLRGTQAHTAAREALAEHGIHSGAEDELNGVHGTANGVQFASGEMGDFLGPDSHIKFKSVNAGPEPTYEEPDEETKDKVVFFFNNVSEHNLSSKFESLQKALHDEHFRWFANFLVDGRAKVEPNYQHLYVEMLRLFGKKALSDEVLRETYRTVEKLLNAESTMQAASERKNLKNLAMWLGSLTLAKDKPIKHRNISFMDLLYEGHQLERLLLVIPFTCNVLAQGARSTLFKPPNPWVVKVIAGLVELYYHFEIKLNQKFEIEVLCKEFGLNVDNIEPSTNLRARPIPDEDQSNAILSDGLDGFDDLSLSGMNRSVANPRFEVDALSLTLPDLESRLSFPPASGSAASQARLRQVVQEAVRTAILEILSPVVERSVTIATITTSKLIHKDFAREPDEERIRKAAQQMVRQLSGSLALATCKEPLKMSMTNYIRMSQADLPEPSFAEGTILMCVNDNLDIACKNVEEQAEERSMPEIESHIEIEIAARRQHRTERPNEPFQDRSYNQWAGAIPDPYKQTAGGLAPEQLAIYYEFARQSRGPANHAQTSSADSGRQLPDVLQDPSFSMSNIHTPSEHMAMPHQPSQAQQHSQLGRMLPPPVPSQAQTNGFMDPAMIEERVQDNLSEINRILKGKADRTPEDYQLEGSVLDLLNQTWDLVMSSPDTTLAMNTAEYICKALYGPMNLVQIDTLIQLLAKLFQSHLGIRREVANWAEMLDDEKTLVTDVTIALLTRDIMQLKKVDGSLARLICEREESAIDSLSSILDVLLLNPHPTALRSDFANSLGALGQWYSENPDLVALREVVNKLKFWSVGDGFESTPDEGPFIRKHQTNYIFSEWIHLYENYPDSPNERMFAAFISQMHVKELIHSPDDMSVFLRLCIDECIESYEMIDERSLQMQFKDHSSKGFLEVDCLARLLVLLVRSQGQINGSAKGNKAAYMDSLLSLITLIMNHHQIHRGDRFNQRIFFRLLSSVLCEWHDFGRENIVPDREILLAFAGNFLTMGPRYFPGFAYSWFMLVAHRFFMSSLLKLPHDDVCPSFRLGHPYANTLKGWEPFAKIMTEALSYVSKSFQPATLSAWTLDIYRGLLRILLILHHDFPEFLAENHFQLCNAVPPHCTQLHNLILSAYPSSFPELPNPFVIGLKVDRLEETRKAPRIAGDFASPLVSAEVKDIVDASLRSANIPTETILRLADSAYVHNDNGVSVDSTLLHSLVIYIGQSATAASSQRGGQPFVSDSPQALLLTRLAKEMQPDALYFLLCAMTNQLRYPNSHTQYFSYALLHLFGTESAQESLDMRQQITRVLLERLHVVKPHPWGLVVTMLELFKNPDYSFWQLPFVKHSPAVSCEPPLVACDYDTDIHPQLQAVCDDLLKSGEERERWPPGQFAQHI